MSSRDKNFSLARALLHSEWPAAGPPDPRVPVLFSLKVSLSDD